MKKVILSLLLITLLAPIFAIDKLTYSVKASGENDFKKCKLWLTEIATSPKSKIEFEDTDLNLIKFTEYTPYGFYTIEVKVGKENIKVTLKDNYFIIGTDAEPLEFGDKMDSVTKPKIKKLEEILEDY